MSWLIIIGSSPVKIPAFIEHVEERSDPPYFKTKSHPLIAIDLYSLIIASFTLSSVSDQTHFFLAESAKIRTSRVAEVLMKCLDNETEMKYLDEIGGVTDILDLCTSDATTSSFTGDVSKKLQDDVFAEASPNYEQFDLEVSVDTPGNCTYRSLNDFNNVGTEPYEDFWLIEEALQNSELWLYYALQQTRPLDRNVDICSYLGVTNEEEGYNPYLFRMSSLPEMITPYCTMLLETEPQKRLPITLVLDLDETLVHSTFDTCEDADFSFPVHSIMQVQTAYVRQRPYLRMFLEAVASMFEIVIFTAGQSFYAERLLDILDPDRTLIGQRIYRDSCVFSEGGYVKDLTILGRDLARIAIVDNTPQVFQLQVENGIPIQSWFGDPTDNALLSLLIFLETLVGVDDVRPIIKKKFCL